MEAPIDGAPWYPSGEEHWVSGQTCTDNGPPWHSFLVCSVPSHGQWSLAPFGDTDQIAQHSFILMQSREISQLQAWMMPLTSWQGFRRADSSTVATAHSDGSLVLITVLVRP